jgi:hypothetical protein
MMALSKQQQLDKLLEGHTTAASAAKKAGCSSGWVRRLLREDRLRGLVAAGVWLVDDRDIDKLTESLSSRSNGKRGTAKRPASSR